MSEMIEFRSDLLLLIFLVVAIGFVILTLPDRDPHDLPVQPSWR